MKTYAKGSRAERELIAFLESNRFLCVRIAGSGKKKNPDVLAFRNDSYLAFECKSRDDERLSLERDQIEGLLEWESVGITCYIAWKLRKGEWYFISPKELQTTPKGNYSVNKETARLIGRKLYDIV